MQYETRVLHFCLKVFYKNSSALDVAELRTLASARVPHLMAIPRKGNQKESKEGEESRIIVHTNLLSLIFFAIICLRPD